MCMILRVLLSHQCQLPDFAVCTSAILHGADNQQQNTQAQIYRVASIDTVLNVTAGEFGSRPWLRVRLHYYLSTDQCFACFAPGTLQVIPLGWNDWRIARRISLVPHPTRSTTLLFNHRVTWVLADHWASSNQQAPSQAEDKTPK